MTRILALTFIAVLATAAIGGRTLATATECGADHHHSTGHSTGHPTGHSSGQYGAAHSTDSASEPPAEAPLSGTHGGRVTQVQDGLFETLLAPDGIRVYAYGTNGVPMQVGAATGMATLTLADGETQQIELAARAPGEGESALYFCPMHPDATQREPGTCGQCGGMALIQQDYLYGAADLPESALAGADAAIRISGLAGADKEILFQQIAPPAADRSATMETMEGHRRHEMITHGESTKRAEGDGSAEGDEGAEGAESTKRAEGDGSALTTHGHGSTGDE